MPHFCRFSFLLMFLPAAAAISQSPPCIETMPGMQVGPTSAPPESTLVGTVEQHASSGTSAEPAATPMSMLMTERAGWRLMFHANGFLADIQQTSPRGGDKLFSTNWVMPMAERRLGPGSLTLRAMLSLEPATITDREYPLLFQQGETAYGRPIVDGQHPHNFFMELAALYDLPLGEKTLVSAYYAPVGDPALGPTAYPHRASASENPVAPLGHHQQDSTHIAGNVATVALTHGMVRLEASGFQGQEPDEHRWEIAPGAMDSWSARLTVAPWRYWTGQYSFGRLHAPEALFPNEDQQRMTASVMLDRPWPSGNLAATALWGRTRSLADGTKENSYLFEATMRFQRSNYAWTRIENAGRSNELLLDGQPLPPGFQEQPIGHVQAYTFGYDRELPMRARLNTAVGAQVTTYGVPGALRPFYGSDPIGVAVFVRIRPAAGGGR